MLLCGIVDQLNASIRDPDATLSYFFFQMTDTRINNDISVLRGLIFMLVGQQPLLMSQLRREYDIKGKSLFEGVNAWTALSSIFAGMLEDPSAKNGYIIVDALDECHGSAAPAEAHRG